MGILDIKILMERIEDAKVLKSVALQVFQMVNDNATTTEQLTEVIEQDDFLTATILKVANSTYYGNSGRIKTVKEATILLGFTGIKSISIASAIIVKDTKNAVNSPEMIVRANLWRHSISTAIAAKYIAEKLEYKQKDTAYVAGLLHDIGKLGIFLYNDKTFYEIESLSREKDIFGSDAEFRLISLDHGQIGAMMLDKWKFPLEISQCAAFHHRYVAEAKDKELLGIVTMANYISNSLGFGSTRVEPINEDIMLNFSMNFDSLKLIITEISEILSHMEILSIEI
jgi:putative nucleotidyltransferase with HDIG domain